MPEIVTWPDEVTVPFQGEVNLLAALVEGGIPITHLCGGKARCSTCRVKIVEGLAGLSPRTEKESAMAQRRGGWVRPSYPFMTNREIAKSAIVEIGSWTKLAGRACSIAR